jgi:hypothetical protein
LDDAPVIALRVSAGQGTQKDEPGGSATVPFGQGKHAPMPTPRHAVAAVTLGDWIHVAGGGAVLGGAVQSAVHEAFTLNPA